MVGLNERRLRGGRKKAREKSQGRIDEWLTGADNGGGLTLVCFRTAQYSKVGYGVRSTGR